MSEVRKRRPGELAFSLILVVFSLFAAWQAWSISGFSSLSSAGMFPMFATFTMAVSGFVILIDTARARAEAKRGIAQRFLADITPTRFLVFAAMIAAYMLALEPAGFLASSFVFLFLGMAFLHRKSLFINLAVSAVSLAVIYFVFRHVFSVVLPAGRLL